MKENKG
jgi:hypothetical protein